MDYPKVKFRLNKELDKRMAIEFLGHNYHGGINFAQGIFGPHPGIKIPIFCYIDNFYKQNRGFLLKVASRFQKVWSKKANSFFNATNTVFHSHPWPKGRYIGYISIFNCGPRFLDNKTFQIFYKNSNQKIVFSTTHEILHFLFYDYIDKKRKDIKNKLNENQIWKLSEIVNEILLRPEYLGKELGFTEKFAGYPEFVIIADKIKSKFKKNDVINKLIDLVINKLQ